MHRYCANISVAVTCSLMHVANLLVVTQLIHVVGLLVTQLIHAAVLLVTQLIHVADLLIVLSNAVGAKLCIYSDPLYDAHDLL
ncbi:hypothetical protein QVD17_06925 [Tagetes erecta]|uniref:Uncharacterized protein n=1 Tax=Tagetes erecta TaxID=13708 RepID=A0AAD8LGV9_TARER|nr:hypothetical protein QVD17_06925 [Tagetes erecta]